jgi:hypothetical protein
VQPCSKAVSSGGGYLDNIASLSFKISKKKLLKVVFILSHPFTSYKYLAMRVLYLNTADFSAL